MTTATGTHSWSKLLLASDGNFYGSAQNGGTNTQCTVTGGCGTIFKMTPRGELTAIYSFSGGADGGQPLASLVQGANGNLYGTATGGATNYGTVFEITLAGQLTTLHEFQGPDGAGPIGALLLASDGNFYGTTNSAGQGGDGTIYRITQTGTLTTVWNFDYTAYGAAPTGALVQSENGDFYGATLGGGTSDNGTIFRWSARGKFAVIHSFDFTHGGSPVAALVEGTDGNFYGATENGGKYVGYGTIYKLTPTGHLTTLHNFNEKDGDVPVGTLIQGADGSFYGTTAYGGPNGSVGTVFSITSSGKLTMLHTFKVTNGAVPRGADPLSGLLQAPNGVLYGDTFTGGSSTACSYGCGVVFSLSMGQN
jgi:uncharacterized repeat protein (TIGR03803 family)